MITRITSLYLGIFTLVLAVLSSAAYMLIARQYHSLLLPALGTPEGALALREATRRVAVSILAFDLPLLIFVGIASWLLARISLQPLLDARERERAFVADAAHQLRSPLATIASVAQAARPKATDGTADSLALISETALDASALIGDLLTLARTPQRYLLSREPVDLAAIVHTCLQEFAPRAKAANITLESEIGSAIINGDPRRMRELVRNLLENALQHARTAIVVRCSSDANRALLQVIDDGLGVEQADREKIFQRFFHGRNSTSGSGLGLAIAQWVARAHDGLLTLDESPEGASFTARIPLVR